MCVDSLNGAPGIKSARYAPTAEERIDKLLNALEGIEKRNAHFTCAMVIVNKKGKILYKTQNDCTGSIMKERKGQNGFGYDPIFFVNEKNKGMAELSPDEKAKVSHRAKSLNDVLNWLKQYR